MVTKQARVEIYEEQKRQVGDEGEADEWSEWRWRVRDGNREIVVSGESYTSRKDAVRGFKAAARAMSMARALFVEQAPEDDPNE